MLDSNTTNAECRKKLVQWLFLPCPHDNWYYLFLPGQGPFKIAKRILSFHITRCRSATAGSDTSTSTAGLTTAPRSDWTGLHRQMQLTAHPNPSGYRCTRSLTSNLPASPPVPPSPTRSLNDLDLSADINDQPTPPWPVLSSILSSQLSLRSLRFIRKFSDVNIEFFYFWGLIKHRPAFKYTYFKVHYSGGAGQNPHQYDLFKAGSY